MRGHDPTPGELSQAAQVEAARVADLAERVDTEAVPRRRRELLTEMNRARGRQVAFHQAAGALANLCAKLSDLAGRRDRLAEARDLLAEELQEAEQRLADLEDEGAREPNRRSVEREVEELRQAVQGAEKGWATEWSLGRPSPRLTRLLPGEDVEDLRPLHWVEGILEDLEERRERLLSRLPPLPDAGAEEAAVA